LSHPSNSNKSKYDSCVLAVATGVPIAEWCRSTGTNRSTVSKWQADKKTWNRDVEAIRRQLLDGALGEFTGAVRAAAQGMTELAKSAASESTRLAVCRAVIQTLIETTEFAELKDRLSEIERKLDEHGKAQQPGSQVGPARATPGQNYAS
jgi:hypothetical protein